MSKLQAGKRAASRRRVVWRRWLSVCTAAVVGACAILLGAFALRRGIPAFFAVPPWVLMVLAVCGCVLLVSRAGRRLPSILGVRHTLAYPPLWVGGMLGAGLLLQIPRLARPIAVSFGLEDIAKQIAAVGASSVAGAAVLVLAFATVGRLRRLPSVSLPAKKGPALETFDDLRTWLKTDEPVQGEADDAFGLAPIAERIARRLLTDGSSAQAVVGPLGAGKSSLLRLVQERLSRRSGAMNVRTVPVALWPFDNSRAAVEGIIQALIDKVGEEVDVTALRKLPESYVEAMSAASGWIGAVARLQGVRSPTQTLAAIDQVAVATGLRFVVWIEDLERFAGQADDAEARLNPIRALLFALDRLEAVTIVTATTSLRMRFDLEKIARFVEDLPGLPQQDVAQLFNRFRNGCRGMRDYVDPAAPAAREGLDGLGDAASRAAFDLFGLFSHRIADALPELCTTPRTLKQGLRSCLDLWEEQIGEIDLDDLLVVSTLRESQPEAFALLQTFLPYWRGERPRDEKERREMRDAWDTALVTAVPEESTRRAVQLAVNFLFESADGKPQGLRQRGHMDYWRRYLSRDAPPASECDQPTLRALVDSDDIRIVNLLADSSTSGAVEDFHSLLDANRVRRLLPLVVESAARVNPTAWQNGDPPGLIPLWRIWLRRTRAGKWPEAEAFEALKQAFEVCVSTNLAVAAQLEHYFVIAESSVPDMLGRENRKVARAHLRAMLVATYRNDPTRLARSLQGAAAPILLWLTWGLDRVRASEFSGVPFDDWSELAPVILAATASAPDAMLPQLACLVVRRTSEFARKTTYAFDPVLAAAMFGDEKRVLSLFEAADPARWTGEEHVLAVFRAAGGLEPRGSDDDEEDDDE
jgi:hypothetical protein